MDWQALQIIALLRWQRHEFLNHLQVISGYLQLQKSERALDYLKQVIAQLEHPGRLMRLKQPDLAVAALLKMEQAASRGITLNIEVHTTMENLAMTKEAVLAVWEAAWELALDLVGDGATLLVSLTDAGQGYKLHFKTKGRAPVPCQAADRLADLAGRHRVPFTWKPETGEIELIFS